jgi:hypothetical protein
LKYSSVALNFKGDVKKMRLKSLISFSMALCLCIPIINSVPYVQDDSILQVSADTTADGFTYDINTSQGFVTITSYTGSATNVVIPSEIDGYPVTTIGKKVFSGSASYSSNWQNNRNIVSVTIPDTVTTIGSYAFCSCSSLNSINIPSSVTSIGDDAFNCCTSLKEITIPNSVTIIGNWAFFKCTSLKEITIPNSVTTICSWAFQGCTSLSSITIPSSVTSIGSSAFKECISLSSITIPSSVTSVGSGAFRNCTNLETATIKSANTKIADNAFDGCYIVNIVYDYEDEPIVTTEPETQKPTYIYDVNQDGFENVIDLLVLKKHLLGIS